MLIDEKHKHLRMMSYRWLISNAIFQAVCLVLICLTIFLFHLIIYEDDSTGLKVKINVLSISIEGNDDNYFSVFEFGPNSDIC